MIYVVFAIVLAVVNGQGNIGFNNAQGGKRRRRTQGGHMTDDVCDSITKMVAGASKDKLVGMLTSGGSQAATMKETRESMIHKCEAEHIKGEEECKFYMTMLPLVDADGSMTKAAWVDSMGSEDDRAKSCKAITTRVNEKVKQLAADPSVPIEMDGDTVKITGDLSNVKPIARNALNSLGHTDDGVSCKVVGGVAAGLIAGASMVGVAIGTLCKTFTNGEYSPLLENTV